MSIGTFRSSVRGAAWVICATLVWASEALPQQRSAPDAAPAASLGKISGRVIGEDKQGIAFVNVIVLGTKQGTMTDENGNFVIAGVPSGTQQLRAQALGYEAIVQTVQVNAGQTVTVNFVFGSAKIAKTLEEIEVRAEKRRELPVDNLTQAVATKAGVVAASDGLHFRGGRSGEVKFQLDGVEASDPLFGGGANIASLAVSGTDILSGGFDAEYGNALSGVVSVSTKEGTDRLSGEVRWDTDRYGDPTKTFDNFDRFTFGFGGPTPLKNLTYFATYEGTFSDTYLRTTMSRPRRTLLDFIQLGNRQSNEINTNLKFAYRPNPKNKITLETINNRSVDTPFNFMWSRKGYVKVTYDTVRVFGEADSYRPRYGTWSFNQDDSTYLPMNLPDHVPTVDTRYRGVTSVWTNQISDKTVWTSRGSVQTFKTLESVGHKLPWEYDTQRPNFWDGNIDLASENNPFFATHGDFPRYSKRNSTTYTAKSDYSTKHFRQHTMKTGVEVKYNRVENLTLADPNFETNGLPGGTRSDFVNFNPEGAAYLQDRWEYEGLVLNAGLRFDVFSPGYQVDLSELTSGKRLKQQFSPRLGIAYPISDKDVLSFHYGWTYQTPARNFIFENRGVGTSVNIRGNPDLEPETNIAYQAGMQHLFSRDISGQFSVFFKDIYGLITTRQEQDDFGNVVNVYFNGDYASSRGFEASLSKSFSHKFSADINYTFSLATGVASNPNDALQFFNGGRLYLPIAEQPLNWDQRHTLSVASTVRDPGRWGFRMLWSYGSGFPFTPSFRDDRKPDPKLENSRRLPSNATLTLDGDKYYKVWGQNVTLFFDARNVLNQPNIQSLSFSSGPNPYVNAVGDDYVVYYTETGRAGGAYLQDINGDGFPDWNPLHDPRVYGEGRNVRLGISVTF